MNETVYFLDMFSEYTPEEAELHIWKAVELRGADLDPPDRRVKLSLYSPTYVSRERISCTFGALRRLYGLQKLEAKWSFGPESISQVDPHDLVDILSKVCPSARAILAGSKWEITPRTLTIRLVANGKDQLEPHLPRLKDQLQSWFGASPEIVMEANGATDAASLFAETEKIRQEAMKSIPAVQLKEAAAVKKADVPSGPADLIYGRPFSGAATAIADLSDDMYKVIVEGEVIAVNHKELKKRNAWVISFDVTDRTSSIRVSQFMEADKARPILDSIAKPGVWLRVQGKMVFDRYDNEMVMQPQGIMVGKKKVRMDHGTEKRVELHLHTSMSSMDALTDVGKVVAQAAAWGHRAIAITDHGIAQAFPDALKASKNKVAGTDQPIKIIYGCEGYFVNDVDDRIVVHGDQDASLTDEFVAFDLETTGLSAQNDVITEIGAVIYKNGEIFDRFQSFVNPHRPLSQRVVDLTGITDAMLKDAPDIEEVLPQFLEFCGSRPLAAHNADFDVGFIMAACQKLGIAYDPTYVDTLIMAQNLLPDLKNHKLNIVADALSLPEFNHHRAVDDGVTVAHMLRRFFEMLAEQGVETLSQINPMMIGLRSGGHILDRQPRHIILYAKNQTGLRNLYRLISYGHLNYYRRVPRIPKSELIRWREGIIVGSACEAGELFQAILGHKSHGELLRIASFYDFLEIQPLPNNMFMLAKGLAENVEELKEFNRTVIRLGKELGKPVVATGDVHFQNPEDEVFRRILLATKGFEDCDRDNPLYFRTTDEMLAEFDYLDPETAHEVVITNPNLLADMCDTIRPVPHNLFAPAIENSVEDLNRLVYGKLHELYGENPVELITKRVETEMHDIISCHYDVIYMSAQKLVQNSLEHGYLVGSRGSVGSSIVAYLSGITEVNSFPPHYRCPKCKYHTFDVPAGYDCGADLPDDVCPHCGTPFAKEGFSIPFETFLGFGGDKVPDIDLNFSGEYQARAHAYCIEMFGAKQVFRAGTIGTVAEKTAYGYAKKYLAERNRTVSKAEENRLAAGCVGVKRTTGQHPGGLVVIPKENEIWDFCPVQHPADDASSDTITTHFEYHSMEENLLKLDMLGHDDPTMIRMMEDMTGVDAKTIPLDDKGTMSIFTSSKILGYENDKLLGPTGAVGVPEFNTRFTRGVLLDTMPDKFDFLVRICGYTHGTDVWLGNAKDLITSGVATVGQTIGARDDIMIYLISCGMPEKRAFKIMESVRKGRGLPPGAEEEMVAAGVPDWYIGSCKKIKYLFPKAHAVAYCMMAFRIAWFKVYYPLAFYAAYFYRRSQKGGFDAVLMTGGKEAVLANIKAIDDDENATAKDEDLLTTLEVVYEFYLRGFSFAPIDIYESHAIQFQIKGNQILPPFVAVSGLGESAAWDIVEGRKGKEFISIEEFSAACPKVSKTHIENLKEAGAFGNLPETSQVTLF